MRGQTHTHPHDDYITYSALDIARIMVRNPDDIMDWPSYEYICARYGNGRALEDLNHAEKKTLFSPQAAAEELQWLGFRDSQIALFYEALHDGLQRSGVQSVKPDIGRISFRERFEIAAYAILAFPYGPPLLANTPDYPLKDQGYSMTLANTMIGNLTHYVATSIFEKREDNPYILCVIPSKDTPDPLAWDENTLS